MARRLPAIASLSENPASVLRSHMVKPNRIPGESNSFFWPLEEAVMNVVYKYASTHT